MAFIPYASNRTITHNIVYYDTVLPVKEMGENIKVSSICDVSEFSFGECMKKILEENKDVFFHTVQYSKVNKKVYFYTDKDISTKTWEDSRKQTYRPLTSKTRVLEEVKRVLISEKNKRSDCISIYEVSRLLKKRHSEYDRLKSTYNTRMNSILARSYEIYRYHNIMINRFDHKNNLLEIQIGYHMKNYKKIILSKEEGDLYIKESETPDAKDILALLGGVLSEYYDEMVKYSPCKLQTACYGSINSNFLVEMSFYEVSISDRFFSKNFELISPNYSYTYHYNCNSNDVVSMIQGQENELFKRIFVPIMACPVWSRETLYNIRKIQLAEEQKMEDEERYRAMKRQKRKEFVQKIFPFLKEDK